MNWRHLVDEALDDGFKEYIGELFNALAKDPSEARTETFKKAVESAKLAYEKAITVLEL